MGLDFGPLTSQTGFRPQRNLFVKAVPQNLVAIRRRVVFAPGWARAWIVSKTRLRHDSGTMGRAGPVDVSHSTVKDPSAMGTSFSFRLVMAVRYAWTSGSWA